MRENYLSLISLILKRLCVFQVLTKCYMYLWLCIIIKYLNELFQLVSRCLIRVVVNAEALNESRHEEHLAILIYDRKPVQCIKQDRFYA